MIATASSRPRQRMIAAAAIWTPARRSSVGGASAGRLAAGEGAVDDQQEQGAADSDKPGPDVEELVEVANVQCAGDEAAHQGPGDPDQRRDDESTGIIAGQDELRDRAGEKPENDPADDSHEQVL